MSENLVDQILNMNSTHIDVEAGKSLFHQDQNIEYLHIVESGLVELTRFHENGNSIILQQTKENSILAEASIYSEQYHCSAIARVNSSLFAIPKPTIIHRLKEDWEFSYLWGKHLAKEVQSTRFQLENISQKTVSERLDGWLSWNNSTLPPKGEWKSLASQISVSPEALYRELAKRKHIKQKRTHAF